MDKTEKKALESLLEKYEKEDIKRHLLIDALRLELNKPVSKESSSTTSANTSTGIGVPSEDVNITHDTFHGKSIVDAVKMYLTMVGKPARQTDEIMDALKRGGIDSPYHSVYPTLLKYGKKDGIEKAGKGRWGLSEWYQNQ